MKTSKKIYSTLLILIAFKSLAFGIIFNSENAKNHVDKKNNISVSENQEQLSQNKYKNKKVVAVFNLPVVTISASKQIKKTVAVSMYENKLMAHVDLPEVEITASKKTKGYKLRTVCFKNTCIATADLPEVVISQKRNQLNADCISKSDLQFNNKTLAVFYKGSFIPSIFLPTITIKANASDEIIASIYSPNKTKNKKMPIKNYVKAETKLNKNLSLVFVKLSDSLFLEL